MCMCVNVPSGLFVALAVYLFDWSMDGLFDKSILNQVIIIPRG